MDLKRPIRLLKEGAKWVCRSPLPLTYPNICNIVLEKNKKSNYDFPPFTSCSWWEPILISNPEASLWPPLVWPFAEPFIQDRFCKHPDTAYLFTRGENSRPPTSLHTIVWHRRRHLGRKGSDCFGWHGAKWLRIESGRRLKTEKKEEEIVVHPHLMRCAV